MNRLWFSLKSINYFRLIRGEILQPLSVMAKSLCYDHTVNEKYPVIMPCKNLHNLDTWRQFTTSNYSFSDESGNTEAKEEMPAYLLKRKAYAPRGRSKPVSPETSIRYLKSASYKTVYGDEPVWVKYRRNFKGQWIPRKTRKACIRGGVIVTGNPCPICRDEYLILHYTNVDLLKQFIDPYTGEIYDTRKTHICQIKLLELEVAIQKAKNCGYITYEVPFRSYNYSEYYPQWKP